jgi:hypothetical protein
MAGDWIKMRSNLWDDPRVTMMADLTESSEATVVGALYWLWATADQHSNDGIMQGLTLRALDRKTGLAGFGNALVDVGWLVEQAGGLEIIRFSDHNGESAKSRAQTARRVANHKSNAKVTQLPLPEQETTVTTALPREREREREEVNIKNKSKKPPAAPTFDPIPVLKMLGVADQTAKDWLTLRKAKRAPVTQAVIDNFLRETGKAEMDLDAVLAMCCVRGWTGFDASWLQRSSAPAQSPAARFDPTAHVNRNRLRPQ